MSDTTTPGGPAHRAETVSTLRSKMNGIHAAAKEPHLNNAQVHKGLRDVASVLDHTLEILETVAGEAAEARQKADEALEKANTTGSLEDTETVAALRRRVVQLKRHERKLMAYRQSADTIRTNAESTNELKRRMASTEASGLRDEVAEILSEIEGSVADVNRKVEDLDQRLTDEAERLDGRITDHEKAVDERFTKERETTNDTIGKIKPPKESKNLGTVKADVAQLSQNMDSTREYVNTKPSVGGPLIAGLAVFVLVFFIVWFATALNLPLAFLCGLGFGSLVAGFVCVILGSRQEELVFETDSETRTESRPKKTGFVDNGLSKFGLSRDSRNGKYDEDDTDTRPTERVTTKETVRESAGSSR